MKKNELEFEVAKLKFQRFETVVRLIAHVFTLGTIALCLWLTFEGIRPLVDGKSAEAIAALASIVEALKLGSIAGYAWGAVMSGAWWFERNSRRRAIRKKSEYQRELENDDPDRSSSGLSDDGATPRG